LSPTCAPMTSTMSTDSRMRSMICSGIAAIALGSRRRD
jgi:hypothetical protein